MEEYISKVDAVDAVERANGNVTWAERDDCKKRLEQLEPVSVVEVVRCKDCQYLDTVDDEVGICHHVNGFGGVMPKDGFCSKGERRT